MGDDDNVSPCFELRLRLPCLFRNLLTTIKVGRVLEISENRIDVGRIESHT